MEQIYFTHTALKHGAYGGLTSIIFFLVLYSFGYNALGATGWLGAWIPALFIFLGIRFYRNFISKGVITYGRAFRMGWNITLSWAFIYAGFTYIFGKTIGQDLLLWQKMEAMEGAIQAKSFFDENFYKTSVDSIENSTLGMIALNDFFMKLIGGAISSLVLAAFMKNTTPITTVNEE